MLEKDTISILVSNIAILISFTIFAKFGGKFLLSFQRQSSKIKQVKTPNDLLKKLQIVVKIILFMNFQKKFEAKRKKASLIGGNADGMEWDSWLFNFA